MYFGCRSGARKCALLHSRFKEAPRSTGRLSRVTPVLLSVSRPYVTPGGPIVDFSDTQRCSKVFSNYLIKAKAARGQLSFRYP